MTQIPSQHCRDEKPIGIREKLFKILTTAHRKCEHGDQKATSVEVNRLYSWIPEELIWVFIKICPTCQFKSSSQEEVTEGVLFVCEYDGYNPNDIHHRDFPQWLRPIPVRNKMISTPSNASSHIGLLPHGISLSTPVDNRTNLGSENFRFNVTNEDQTKISDLAERRRIRNRIAQRKYRKMQLLSVSYIPGDIYHRNFPKWLQPQRKFEVFNKTTGAAGYDDITDFVAATV
ncbi:hypothetical protein AJ78_08858 [Emergomyces pasteurianus Ep9510]|uniref:Integrase zinc-binding domain-containing protein n=1 Tax=Emergomyces pasteurianus Ep9510 TaxID=1447872 RepID=A0A1J9P0Q0_9EURO|nr:hypothetical protein AJ78_08858 [Emergomyces pasteurianus Ep9510]